MTDKDFKSAPMTNKEFVKAATDIVHRTAKNGLDDPDLSKWILIWTCDVVGEIGEVFELLNDPFSEENRNKIHVECGDVIWGIFATCMALDIDPMDIVTYPHYDHNTGILEALLKAVEILDQAKKLHRDGLEHRRPDIELFTRNLQYIFSCVTALTPRDTALAAVEAKLWLRYPNGFNPTDSVNRSV